MTRILLASLVAVLSLPGVAAQGAEARCHLPKAHERFDGVVIAAHDGDTLKLRTSACLALNVRLGNFDAPELNQPGGREATLALRQLALGQRVRCQTVRARNGSYRSYGRAVARCSVRGVDLGEAMRAAGVSEGGR